MIKLQVKAQTLYRRQDFRNGRVRFVVMMYSYYETQIGEVRP